MDLPRLTPRLHFRRASRNSVVARPVRSGAGLSAFGRVDNPRPGGAWPRGGGTALQEMPFYP
jgi:hypothetical protein